MKGTSTKLVMAAALMTALSLTIVLLLVLVLLAQLYCSILLRRRRLTTTSTTTITATSALPLQSNLPLASPPGSVYNQGVLRAPRNFLYPAIVNKREGEEDLYKQEKQQQQQLSSMTVQEARGSSSPQCVGIIYSTSPSPSFMSVPPIHQEVGLEASSSSGSSSGGGEHLVYISNPIYEQPSKGDGSSSDSCSSAAAFETPHSSPSHLEMEDNEEEGEITNVEPSSPLSSTNTPPLTPMKKLSGHQLVVGAGSYLSLREVCSSRTCSGLSSSSSGSPCTSPSW